MWGRCVGGGGGGEGEGRGGEGKLWPNLSSGAVARRILSYSMRSACCWCPAAAPLATTPPPPPPSPLPPRSSSAATWRPWATWCCCWRVWVGGCRRRWTTSPPTSRGSCATWWPACWPALRVRGRRAARHASCPPRWPPWVALLAGSGKGGKGGQCPANPALQPCPLRRACRQRLRQLAVAAERAGRPRRG
jgi:hypothetical protein